MSGKLKLVRRKIHLINFIFLIVAVVSPVAYADYRNAELYFNEGEYNYAIIELKNLLRDRPNHANGRLLMGRAQLEIGNYPAANQALKKAQELGAEADKLALPMAHLAIKQGNPEKAFKWLTPETQQKISNQSKVHWVLGYAYLGNGQQDMARSSFEKSIGITPTAQAHVGLATMHWQSKQTAKALETLDQALAIDPSNHEAWFAKGRIYGGNSKMREAIESFSSLLEYYPTDYVALLARSEAYFQTKQFNLASTDTKAALKLNPSFPLANLMQAKLYIQAKDYKNAINSAEKVVKFLPDNLAGNLLLGSSHYIEENYQQSKFYLNKVLNLQPTHLQATKLLASIHLKQGDPKQAIALLEPLNDLHKRQDVSLLNMLGQAYFMSQQFEKGTNVLYEAKKIDPEIEGINARLAHGEMAIGNSEKAYKLLHADYINAPDNSDAALQLIKFHLRNEEFDTALERIEESISRFPKNVNLLHLKGVVLNHQNNPSEAKIFLKKATDVDDSHIASWMLLADIDKKLGNIKDSEAYYKKIIRIKPDHLSSHLSLAAINLHQKNTQEAIQWLRKGRDTNPNAFEPVDQLVRLYLQQKQFDKAIREAKTFYTKQREQLPALKLLFHAQSSAGKTADAIATLELLIKRTPTDTNQRLQIIHMLTSEKNYVDALRHVDFLIEKSPNNIVPHALKASIYIQSNQFEKANEQISTLKLKFPSTHLADQLNGDLLIKRNQPGKALEKYKAAYKLVQSKHLMNTLTDLYKDEEKYADAIEVLKIYLTKKPSDLDSRFKLAALYQRNKQYEKALYEYNRLDKIQPDNPVLLNNIAWVYWHQQDPRGFDLAKKAYQLAPELSSISDTLGWFTLHEGDPKEALSLLSKTVKQDAYNPEFRYHYAFALHKNNQSNKARTELIRLLRDFYSFDSRVDAEALLKKLN